MDPDIPAGELIKAALQAAIDEDRPGWTVGWYVAVTGLARINADGEIESTASVHYPEGQPDFISNGLLDRAAELVGDTYENVEDE